MRLSVALAPSTTLTVKLAVPFAVGVLPNVTVPAATLRAGTVSPVPPALKLVTVRLEYGAVPLLTAIACE